MEKKIDNPTFQLILGIVIVTLVVFLWAFIPFIMSSEYSGVAEQGAVGDRYGTVNALFAGLAFAGIIVTLLLQQRALALQREEFRNQIDEMKQSREEFCLQNELIKAQIGAHLLDIRTKSRELKAQAVRLQVAAYTPGTNQHQNGVKKIEGYADSILNMVGQFKQSLPETLKDLKQEDPNENS